MVWGSGAAAARLQTGLRVPLSSQQPEHLRDDSRVGLSLKDVQGTAVLSFALPV